MATPTPTKTWRVSLWQILPGLRAEHLIAQVREVLEEMDTSNRCGGSSLAILLILETMDLHPFWRICQHVTSTSGSLASMDVAMPGL